MINKWILEKINLLKNETIIILKDPQRMLRSGDFLLDEWSQQHDFTTLMCTGNLALRAWLEVLRREPEVKLLLVDRSRVFARRPRLFYPDLQAQAAPQAQITLSLRDFLIEKTNDNNWPQIVDENRQISALILEHLETVLNAHANLRAVSAHRFSDQDFYKILFGAVLKINPFEKLSPAQVRKLCIEQSHAFSALEQILPPEVMESLRKMIQQTEAPFNQLLEGNSVHIMRAFNLAAVLHQHGLDYSLLLGNIDQTLMSYKDIAPGFLELAMQDQIKANPDQVHMDIQDLEDHLQRDPNSIELILKNQLQVEDADRAYDVLKKEKLSEMIRRTALYNLFIELFQDTPGLNFHKKIIKSLEAQEQDPSFLVLRRPSPQWEALLILYKQAIEYFDLLIKLAKNLKKFRMPTEDEFVFDDFAHCWNQEQLNRLEYYAAKINRQMRVGDIKPLKSDVLWISLEERWEKAHTFLKNLNTKGDNTLAFLDKCFQDLYQKNYTKWIEDPQSP
nr:hypothetical protein [Anaerolineaceae bacterium]